MNTNLSLWRGTKFLPLWCSQFLSALNDNLFRYSLNTALLFGVIAISEQRAKILVSLSAALFILPYLVVSGISGQLADKYSKSMLLRWCRGLEIFVFALAGYALLIGHIPLLITSLLLTGVLAAFYGPVKHAITPELVTTNQLNDANGAIESGTYLAILLGTLIGTSIIVRGGSGPSWTVVLMMAVGIVSWIASLLTPKTPDADPDLVLDWNVPKQSWDLVRWGAADSFRFRVLLAHSWFWFVGTAVLSQLTIFVRDDLHSVPIINTLILALFACGVGLGALTCSVLLRGQVSLRYAAVSAFGMGFWSIALAALAYSHPAQAGPPLSAHAFLSMRWSWAMLISVVLLASNAGLYVVPLVSTMQVCVPDNQRARLLSLSNIWFAIFIIAGSLLSTMILQLGGHTKTVFGVVGVMSAAVSAAIYFWQPRETLKGLFAALLRALYRVEVKGLENLDGLGESAVFVANHQSLLDGLLIGTFVPGDPVFAIDPIAASRWWARPVVTLVDIFTLNPLQPMSVRRLIQTVQSGRRCVIFPEGRLTQTGGLMKIYPGPAMIAEKSNAPVVPIRLDGPQFTPFGYMRSILPLRWFPKITIHILPPEIPASTDDSGGEARREAMTSNLYDLMAQMVLNTQPKYNNLWEGLLAASNIYGEKVEVLEDAERNPITYARLVAGSYALGAKFAALTEPSAHVGLLLPTGLAGVVTFFALQSEGRVPAMLNFTAGPAAINAAISSANIKTVITAHEFVEKGKLEKQIDCLDKIVKLVYLEDIRNEISPLDKAVAALKAKFHSTSASGKSPRGESTAVILFTSGSEGLPKGVALSHRNLMDNVEQLRTVIAYNPTDVIFNSLPIFHSFGLTGGVLTPILHGVKAFLHPTPLQYRIIPELVYHSNATIMFGTDTFLNGYAKAANGYDLYKVRMVFAGAERVRPETTRLYAEKFGVPIYEGYGVTECSPVVAVNTPMYNRVGTVGRLLPAVKTRLETVPGIDKGAQLWVHGPNVMKGYFKADRPGVLQPLEDGWYDTGDIVSIDEAGFITINGRVKRFAKIAGEMVSMAAVEQYAQLCWPSAQHAVISIPDAKKGEALLLITTEAGATVETIAQAMKKNGATELSIPKSIKVVDAIPLLGSGKTDFVALRDALQTS